MRFFQAAREPWPLRHLRKQTNKLCRGAKKSSSRTSTSACAARPAPARTGPCTPRGSGTARRPQDAGPDSPPAGGLLSRALFLQAQRSGSRYGGLVSAGRFTPSLGLCQLTSCARSSLGLYATHWRGPPNLKGRRGAPGPCLRFHWGQASPLAPSHPREDPAVAAHGTCRGVPCTPRGSSLRGSQSVLTFSFKHPQTLLRERDLFL